MAQVLAVPGDVRHSFSYVGNFSHDFGRITGIAATSKGNILLCDYDKKNIILVDALGNYITKLNVDSEPYDVAITSQNIGYITQPKSRSVLQIDPDRMVELFKATCNDLSTTVFCVSAIPNTGKDFSKKKPGYLGVKIKGFSYAFAVNHDEINITDMSTNQFHIGSCVVKFHTVDENTCISIIGGQNYITYKEWWHCPDQIYNIATMETPTDVCSDDYGHIYVIGQGSNNMHRLEKCSREFKRQHRSTQDLKVLDIPLDTHHRIKEPVAVCFNQDYSKLYVVNERGKSVLVFDVI